MSIPNIRREQINKEFISKVESKQATSLYLQQLLRIFYFRVENGCRRKAFIIKQRTCIDLYLFLFACLTLTLCTSLCHLQLLNYLITLQYVNESIKSNIMTHLGFEFFQQGRVYYFLQ